MYKICALIPTYNHYQALPHIVARLLAENLTILIIDDGSNAETQKALNRLAQQYPALQIIHLPTNQGKGAAIKAGLQWIAKAGFTHAFQLDGDGQHSLEKLTDFLQLAEKNPHALLSGQPIYDTSVPLSRKIGRWLTHIWVWVETLSLQIRDSMCGFRIYPVQKTLAVIAKQPVGDRMDFDTEIMVRLFWQGTPVMQSPVAVTYPQDNHSNFDVVADNWRITKMHTRLFFGMFKRLPALLQKGSADENHQNWATLKERGTFLGMSFLAGSYRLLGRSVCLVIAAPVAGYFYLTSPPQRRASQQFLQLVWQQKKLAKPPNTLDGLRHFMQFVIMMMDKFAAWTNRLNWDQIEANCLAHFRKVICDEKGGMLLVSHLGNMEFCRAAANIQHKQRVHVLLHSKNAQRFNQMLNRFNPQSNMNVIEVTEIGPDTIIYLKNRIEAGDWVVIAGDRVPVTRETRVSLAQFLGREAPFSQGPYILGALLECPVYTAFAVREKKQFKVFIDLFAQKILLNRKERDISLQQYAQKYASQLESYCLKYPYQWFNFFDFWRRDV